MRGGAIVVAASLIAFPAVAQQTNCFTTGYGDQQTLQCNTIPAPDNSSAQALQQSEANFANSLVNLAARIQARRAEKAELAAYEQEVEAFAASPDHPRFAELAPDIEKLIRSGRASNLQDAYTLAVADHPEVTTPH